MRLRTHAIVALCLAVAATACGPTLNEDELEQQLRGELHSRFPSTTWDVACPSGVAPEAGATFECTATAEDGRRLELEITQDDDDGRVTWRIVGVGSGTDAA
jgi:hypothetical protein